jgi:hypothetical protein
MEEAVEESSLRPKDRNRGENVSRTTEGGKTLGYFLRRVNAVFEPLGLG